MHRSLLVIALLGCGTAGAEPPPYNKEIYVWATAAGMKMNPFRNCRGIEEKHFGSMGSVCWSVKSTREQAPPGSRMFPRMEIVLAVYAHEAKAKERMAKFRTVPEKLDPLEKAYPLRAGFRLKDRVVIVTTDAFAFQQETFQAATELARALGGTELTCWKSCTGKP